MNGTVFSVILYFGKHILNSFFEHTDFGTEKKRKKVENFEKEWEKQDGKWKN